MLGVVDEELVAVVVAGVAEPLDGLVFEQLFLIAEAAVLELVGPDVFGEVAGGHARRAGLEHQNFDALFGQFLGDPAAARAGADHDHVIGRGGHRQIVARS